MTNSLISVITVVFNGGKSIENTILSVINQTYENIEYIIIDGGSTDNTIDIIKKYDTKISYWISESDKGIYDAKIKGLLKSTGSWINFMNSGDSFVANDTVEKISAFLKDEFNIVYGDCLLKYNDTKVSIYKKSDEFEKIKYHIPFCYQSAFVRTSLIMEYKFDLKYSYAGDYNFFCHAYKNKKTNALRVPIPVSLYDMHGVSNSLTSLKEYYNISQEHATNRLIPLYHFSRLNYAKFKIVLKKILPKTVIDSLISFKININR